ncbi:MAG: hypothetical protein KGZ58_06815 [Ignavibacteriales bacterium]|nr:hypothetical protein [Ignavibacteriales bacterium]
MKKYIRKHLKDEKRVLMLMYKKGIFELLGIDYNCLSWEYLKYGKRQRKRPNNTRPYFDTLPELHVWSQDYWGEGDSHSVVDSLKQYLFWETAKEIDEESGFPINHKYPTTKFLIHYLNELPTKNSNSKFNRVLKCSDE